MSKHEDWDSIAVLIDADNAQPSKLREILDEISLYGRIVVKKAYGNWKDERLKNWEEELNKLAIKPEQRTAICIYNGGKCHRYFFDNWSDGPAQYQDLRCLCSGKQ